MTIIGKVCQRFLATAVVLLWALPSVTGYAGDRSELVSRLKQLESRVPGHPAEYPLACEWFKLKLHLRKAAYFLRHYRYSDALQEAVTKELDSCTPLLKSLGKKQLPLKLQCRMQNI